MTVATDAEDVDRGRDDHTAWPDGSRCYQSVGGGMLCQPARCGEHEMTAAWGGST